MKKRLGPASRKEAKREANGRVAKRGGAAKTTKGRLRGKTGPEIRQARGRARTGPKARQDQGRVTTGTGASSLALEKGSVRGAEATLTMVDSNGRPAVEKRRIPKIYRHREIDSRLRRERTRLEARLLHDARSAGCRTPIIYDVDLVAGVITMERLPGRRLKDVLDSSGAAAAKPLLEAAGSAVARLHASGIIHGDLTTSNMLVTDGSIALIDFGLGAFSVDIEDMGTDLHAFQESLTASHAVGAAGFRHVMNGYARGRSAKAVARRLTRIAKRGRYKGGE
ncbi:MAG: Kae1-associated serine/threonine protein kinase [Euryarchaeota archaeon]|nr:Kae1-associated serine/threonine protein kinase [Euryarchaeota archaeon]